MDSLQKTYLEEAGSRSTLYRGRLPRQYFTAYNGNPFWESKAYTPGEIMFNGKLYQDVLLNIDACHMDLLCRFSNSVTPIVPDRNNVQYARIGNSLFVNLREIGFLSAPEGYLKVEKDGPAALFSQVRKIFRSDGLNHNNKEIGYYDPEYKEKLTTYFLKEEKFYTIKDGQVKRISARAFRKALNSQTPETPYVEEMASRWKGTTAPAGNISLTAANIKGVGLPDGYFDSETTNKEDSAPDDQATLKATYRNKIYIIGKGEGNPTVTLEGTITELETQEPMAGVVIFDDVTSTFERSNRRGHFSITLPGGENVINFRADGKEDISLHVRLLSDGSLNVELPDKIEALEASIVSAESMANHRTTTMGIQSVSMKTMNKVPSAFGEGDILKAVLTLPGVKTVGEASGGFNVRGGSQDQNLVLFNGNTIYNPSHLFGIFSAFNPDVIDNIDLYKSAIPAEYGGRISSVLSVRTKDGDRNRFRGSAGIGLLTSRLHAEGPIGDKTSIIAAARSSYSNWLLNQLPKNSAYHGGGANFYDANLGITHHFNNKNTLSAYGYLARDNFSFSPDSVYNYSNANFSVLFRHKGAGGGGFRINAGYDFFSNTTGISSWQSGAFNLYTDIQQGFIRSQAYNSIGQHNLAYGLDVVLYSLNPGKLSPRGDESDVLIRKLDRDRAIEPAAYIQDNWSISEKVSVEGGIRVTSLVSLNDKSSNIGPEFRLSGRYSPLDNLSFKAGFSSMRQNIHLISNSASISPMDTWKLSDARIAPTTGWQIASGAYWTLLGSGIDLSVELYYKHTRNALDFKPGAILSMNPNLADELIPVFGKSYGIELMAKKSTGKLTGWASYSYSKSLFKEMGDRGYEAIAAGNWYNTPHDKPHEVKISGNYALSHRYSISANLDYSTGRPITIPMGYYESSGRFYMAYSERNSYRLPDYFRLDAALNIDPGHYKRALFHTTFTIGVYNLTGRKNAYSAFFVMEPTGVKSYMLSVFATAIPYANINILF
ncbi:MAG: TonB-dependent receptor plug domain-containing protein [Bacteroidales bacterium]|nr:TonB-dependent receptor plug domain-containing protein [Bacteroidales bacterium]